MNLSYQQANNFLTALIQNVNHKIVLHTNRENLDLNIINTANLSEFFNEYEQLANLTNMINSIQSNLTVMRQNYSEFLIGFDLSELSNLANMSQKLLHEVSKSLGNTIAIDNLKINIENKDRDISDLKFSLEMISSRQIFNNKISSQENDKDKVNNTQLDGAIFDKILNLGSEINLVNFKLKTLEKIQELQKEKNLFLKQLSLLNLPNITNIDNLTVKKAEKRILELTFRVNDAVTQIRNFSQPEDVIQMIKSPELVLLNSKNFDESIKFVCYLTIIGFLILTFISFLIPYKK